eukprot:171761-Amphidinium_carterae.1
MLEAALSLQSQAHIYAASALNLTTPACRESHQAVERKDANGRILNCNCNHANEKGLLNLSSQLKGGVSDEWTFRKSDIVPRT